MCLKDFQIGAKITTRWREASAPNGSAAQLVPPDPARVFLWFAKQQDTVNILLGPSGSLTDSTSGLNWSANLRDPQRFDIRDFGDLVQGAWDGWCIGAIGQVFVVEGFLTPNIVDVPISDLFG